MPDAEIEAILQNITDKRIYDTKIRPGYLSMIEKCFGPDSLYLNYFVDFSILFDINGKLCCNFASVTISNQRSFSFLFTFVSFVYVCFLFIKRSGLHN